ncbi:MAG: thioesterase family protein [Myxococcota bacterium]
MSTRFDTDTEVRPTGEGAYEARLDPGWWIVAGPNGGYLAAILLRALGHAVDDASRTPRSLTVHYTAVPQEGRARIETRVERRGRSLTNISGRLLQGERLIAVTLAAFSKPRAALELADARMPEVPPPEQCDPRWEKHIEMHDRYEYRWALGDRPFSNGTQALLGAWIRPAEPRRVDAPLLAAYCDAFPPALFSRVADGALAGGLPTVDLTVHFREPLPLPDASPDDFTLGVFRTRVAREGFLEEDGEIWSRGGVLLAHSRQLAVVR